MSYAERRRRKNLRAKGPTPRQRRLHPELWGQHGELDEFTHYTTYALQPDGSKLVVAEGQIVRGR